MEAEKKCSTCGEMKKIKLFTIRKSPNGHIYFGSQCIKCHSEVTMASRKKRMERVERNVNSTIRTFEQAKADHERDMENRKSGKGYGKYGYKVVSKGGLCE